MIDYNNIHKSIEYYSKNGFQRIESPWTVSEYISNITKPKDRTNFTLEHNKKVLVASGEQSFLYLYLKNFLPKGKFQTVTPCFRDEMFDLWHTKYFIKNELIITDNVNLKSLLYVIDIAAGFFSQLIGESVDIIKIDNDSYDISYRNIELGSYGIRSVEFLTWIYATGCAEPRLSKVIEISK